MPNELNSVEDIDTMLDNEFNLTGENDEDTNVDDVIEDNQADIDVSADESENNGDENETDDSTDGTKIQDNESDNKPSDNNKATKPTAEDKKDFAFSQMRRENSELKQKAKESEQYQDFLKDVAAQYGYNTTEDFMKAYNDAKIAKEAKDKGYDPVLYKQLQDSNRRIEQLEQERAQEKLYAKANDIKNAMDKAIADYNLGENGRTEIFDRLEKAGYSADDILSSPNPEIVIKGVLLDKVAEISKQKQIDKLNELDNFADEKHTDGSSAKSFSLDALVDKEMEEYAKEYYS